jgi:hypothetical protein
MNILKPPKNYIDYRCYVHGLSGQELVDAQAKFYKKHPEWRPEIINFFNWMIEQRNLGLLPVEKIEVRENDGKKHGRVVSAMIYDIEYWIENNKIKQRKVYIADRGVFGADVVQERAEVRDKKMESTGEHEEEVPF